MDETGDSRSGVTRRGFLKGVGVAGVGALVSEYSLPTRADVPATQPAPNHGLVSGNVEIVLNVNGHDRRVTVEPRTTLLNALRNNMVPQITGPKLVCDMGTCGCCTVLLDDKPVYGCLTLAIDVVGRKITTVEGIGTPQNLSPVQAAFGEHDAMMCGFCTDGFVTSITGLLKRNPNPSEDEVREACKGNFCRCGTYPRIFQAALTAAKNQQGVRRIMAESLTTDGPLSWGPNNAHRLLNTRLPRVDFPYKTTGTADYSYDVNVPGMLHARILKSPYAHAHIVSIDLKPALKISGVRAAVLRVGPGGTVRFEGDPVAAVAADTMEIAEDALYAIDVKYEQLPFVVTAEDAIKPGAPTVFNNDPRVEGNIRRANRSGNEGAVNDALKSADVVVEAQYRTPILHHCCLETHVVVVDYRGGDSATVYCSTQGTFSIVGDSARALGKSVPESNVVGIVHYMGGGFGSKGGIGAEGQLACALSKQTRRPVKMALPRRDEFVMAGNGPGSWHTMRAGATNDGRLVALHTIQYGMGGVGAGRIAAQPYIYHAEHAYLEAGSIHTNEDASRPLRAPGHPQACFAMESMMDELAYKIGMDPLEFRIRNLDTDDDHIRQLQRGAREIGWVRRSQTPGATPGVVKRGFGCACGQWGGGGGPQCVVTVAIAADGAVSVLCGTQDLGTGTRTYMVAIVAEELGLEMSDVKEKIGDSRLGRANFSGGSSTTGSLSPAVKSAAMSAKAELARYVAPLLKADPKDLVFADRKISANGSSLTWKQACAALSPAGISVRGEWRPGLNSGGTHGACFAEVEVDTETGHVQVLRILDVQDCGLPLNRFAVESQINGGMVQGIGLALLEGRVMDANLGIMVNSSFMDYKIPGCLEMPREMLPLIDDEDPRQQVVGVGEPPSIPPAAAIANAIYNACGARVRELPITPDKILMALNPKA